MAGIAASNEAQIAGMLSLFEYLDYHMGVPGMDFKTLVDNAETYVNGSNALKKKETDAILDILKAGLEKIDGLAELRLTMSDHGKGIEADAFVSDRGDAYVAYRGTGDGKWIDNGRGMTEALTESQEQASLFYDRVVEQCGLDVNTNLIVTGHSKGGNNAQAVTLNSRYRALIDKCFSFDGQGMSKAAIKRYSCMTGFEEQLDKMYGINGKNDLINTLGNQVIPDEHMIYIETNTDAAELTQTHAMQYLYYRRDGKFDWSLNEETDQRELGRYGSRLSKILMNMPEDMRESCAVAIMQLIELPEEMMIGYNGDHASWSDMCVFLHYGLPAITYSIIGTKEGQEALCEILKDMVANLIKEFDVWEIMGNFVGTLMLSPILLPIIGIGSVSAVGLLEGMEFVIDTLAALEKLREILGKIGHCIQECMDAIGEFFNQIDDWIRYKVSGRPVIHSAAFVVHMDSLHHAAEETCNMKRLLQQAALEMNHVGRSLPMRGIMADTLKMQINYVTFYVNQVSNRAGILERVLNQTVGTYERYECRIANSVKEMA